jgi:uncharacterized membrane protein HdeD (DUF308 family)
MLEALALNWPFLLFRAVIGLLFGLVALTWPDLTVSGLVPLFGAYALSDGLLALLLALGVRGRPGFGSLLFEAIVRLAVGIVAFVSPGIVALTLVEVFAAWAILSGSAAISAAIALRRELTGEWPLPFAGFLSLVFGVLLLVPGPPPDLDWVFGPYAMLFGMTLLALALRLRKLAEEIAHT